MLEAGYPAWSAVIVGLCAGGVVGLINESSSPILVFPPSSQRSACWRSARSVAVVLSGNRMIYKFGPGGPGFKALGSGSWSIAPNSR